MEAVYAKMPIWVFFDYGLLRQGRKGGVCIVKTALGIQI